MSGRQHYCNARLADPATGFDGPGGVLVEEGQITAAGAELREAGTAGDAETVDCGGQVLAPGIVDMRVFIGEPGERHKESFGSAGRAAAAGGVTTIIAQPDTTPPLDEPEILEFVLRRAASDSCVRVHPMAALTRGREGERMAEYAFLLDAGAVALTDADRAVADAAVFRRCLAYASSLDALVVHHIQEPALSARGCATEGEFASRLGLPGIPAAAEAIQLQRDLELAALAGARYHADQISTAAAVDVLRRARERGQTVTASVSAVHLALNELDIADYRTFCKLRPPLRGESDRQAVEAAIAEGLLDVMVSSHRPQDEESKRQPYEQADPGAVGLETLLSVALRLVHGGLVDMPKLFEMLSLAPARLLGLDCGRLQTGAPADLVLFDPDAPWTVDRTRLRSKCRNTPFDGMSMQGQVLSTIVAGKEVYSLKENE